MKIQRTTINHVIIMALFFAGLFALVWFSAVLFRLILPYAYKESIYLMQAFVGISWVLAWILRGLYRNNRDLSVNDMGKITLKTYLGEVEQVYANKYENGDTPFVKTVEK